MHRDAEGDACWLPRQQARREPGPKHLAATHDIAFAWHQTAASMHALEELCGAACAAVKHGSAATAEGLFHATVSTAEHQPQRCRVSHAACAGLMASCAATRTCVRSSYAVIPSSPSSELVGSRIEGPHVGRPVGVQQTPLEGKHAPQHLQYGTHASAHGQAQSSNQE